ncbi:MAG: LLM class flavin-dependent oxidoreductase [Dehalococcoidia bacterium]|jgi:alkanesulfonate monooxygenase SsuD/methylene tetrahydromethanopterin reductase-like flavin-dependent oxidoreductase (luciferase family)|nr:LLM class flavin-dependent oxidoreductase [Dehalococcoidia bacterium]
MVMRLGVRASMGSDWRQQLEKVQIAEDLGYELVADGEAWGVSVIPWFTILAQNTSKMQIVSSILNCYSRSAAALAQDLAVLDQLSEGRMVLGLGSSGEFVVEHFHGVKFEKPLRRLREYVEIFNMLIAGEPLHYDGQIFKLERGFKLEYERPRTKIPVYIAGITPRSIRQTGEVADGIIPIHWPKAQFAPLKEQLGEAAAGAGRPDAEVTILAQVQSFVLDGDHDEDMWQAARQPLFHYINRMGVFYWQMLERNGFEAEVAASKAAWAERDREGAIAAISDDMVREIQVIGPVESVREQLQERSEVGADVQMLNMPRGEVADVGRQLEALLK